MIKYSNDYLLAKIFKMHGSVFPKAFFVAIPCALLTGLLSGLIHEFGIVPDLEQNDSILKENAAWSGFSFLVGFLIVFRTSQAYNRFWDGCTTTHRMNAEWFDGFSSIIAFTKYSTASDEAVTSFKSVLVRLFSMLHAAALADIECDEEKTLEETAAFRFKLIDPAGIDDVSLMTLMNSEARVELIFQWIQQLIVENIETEVLSIPSPILSRCFQEIANGMVAFHDAMKISRIPFPFPYAQVCDTLLTLHWMVVPFVMSAWVAKIWWAIVFGFAQVFVLWTLNFIAIELENPFGMDANDLDGGAMQEEMNEHLLLMLKPSTERTPKLSSRAHTIDAILSAPSECWQHGYSSANDLDFGHTATGASFVDAWSIVDKQNSNVRGAIHHVSPDDEEKVVVDKHSHSGWHEDQSDSRVANPKYWSSSPRRDSNDHPEAAEKAVHKHKAGRASVAPDSWSGPTPTPRQSVCLRAGVGVVPPHLLVPTAIESRQGLPSSLSSDYEGIEESIPDAEEEETHDVQPPTSERSGHTEPDSPSNEHKDPAATAFAILDSQLTRQRSGSQSDVPSSLKFEGIDEAQPSDIRADRSIEVGTNLNKASAEGDVQATVGELSTTGPRTSSSSVPRTSASQSELQSDSLSATAPDEGAKPVPELPSGMPPQLPLQPQVHSQGAEHQTPSSERDTHLTS